MAVFRDTEHLYQVLEAFFERVANEAEVAESLLAGRLVIRFRYSDPDGQITVDLRKAQVSWKTGDSALEPDVEMIQSADTAHQFWLGRLNVPTAIATRRVVSRGPVAKALKLLPAVKPAFALYEQTLRELGYEHMLPTDKGSKPSLAKGWQRFVKLLGKLRRREQPNAAALNAHFIPLIDRPEVVPSQVQFKDQKLPAEESALKVEMLRRMMLIREFEQHLSEANKKGQIPTEAIHLSIGQEATAVGVCFALRADDYIATTHRGHGHMLAKGVGLDGMMAELLGKASGLCQGKGGSMHVTDASLGAIGANGIVGASPLVAAGAAHATKLRGSDQVAVAFFGDGATNQGMFHEGLNFAAVFDLPAVFVVENNLYGEFTPLQRHTRVTRLADRVAAYGMPGQTVDGNDPWAVYQAMQMAVQRARRGEGPTLLECLTYRWHGHMEGETADYRSAAEIAEWKDKCPVKLWRHALLEQDVLSADEADGLQHSAREAVQRAFEKASNDPEPARQQLTAEVYSPEASALYAPATEVSATGPEITTSQALADAIAEEMERDERVYLLGEDVATGGYFAVTAGLVDRFGTDRIVDTPISEYAIVGSAVGAAMTGARPVAEILFSDFLTTCADPIINQAAKLRYMSGGQYSVPLVIRTPGGAGLGMAAQHSQSLEALFTNIAGLIVLAPATPFDAKGLLKSAIRSNNPVLFFENKLQYAATGPVPQQEFLVPIGVADIKRQGSDLTLVSIGAALGKALEAAERLAQAGSDIEVVDLRSLVPMDLATVVRSVAKTGHLVTVEDAALCHGFGSEVLARVVEVAFDYLKAAPRRVAGANVPIAYNSGLENAAVPDVDAIAAAVQETLGGATLF